VSNVVDLMKLQPRSEHPHGLSDKDFDVFFTADKPIIFAYHGYPRLIHRLTYRRTNRQNLHVRGYKEEGTTSTPFDMVVKNNLDRLHLVADVIDRVPQLGPEAAYAKQVIRDKLIEHKQYIAKYGDDLPKIRNWKWETKKQSAGATCSCGFAAFKTANIELSITGAHSSRMDIPLTARRKWCRLHFQVSAEYRSGSVAVDTVLSILIIITATAILCGASWHDYE
jgi:hypothetical protein